MSADRKEKSVKTLCFQLLQCDIGSKTRIKIKFDPQLPQHLHLTVDNFPRQSVSGYPQQQHAAGYRMLFDHPHAVTL